jgi:hypothetical protein
MLSVMYAWCHALALYAKCRYAECHHAECHGALGGPQSLDTLEFVKFQFSECRIVLGLPSSGGQSHKVL